MSLLHHGVPRGAFAELSCFRAEFYACLIRRRDALFELGDALLCADGPVKTLVELSLEVEHQRGHGALYGALNRGSVDVTRLRRALAGLPLPRTVQGRLVLAVDVSNWLRPDANTSPERLFCHTYGRGRNSGQMVPGWPYSFVAALESGRTSWTAVLDALRLRPWDDAIAVTAGQVREVFQRLYVAGQWQTGDPPVLIVVDVGYDVTRLAFLLADLPVELLDRMRSDRVLFFPPPSQPASKLGRKPRHGAGFVFEDPSTHPCSVSHHGERHRALRTTGRRHRLEPPASAADPALGLGRPPRPAARHRRHRHPSAGRPPARRPQPQADLAVVVRHRRQRRRCGPAVAGVPAQVRP
ncbi:transposase [Streptomyces sp. MMBL 11-3]|uniref:transposase n=1 Tax=Streptomyces sp. MMBL 11-3 TaxID=3382639 RepID=UPI0039B614E5